MTINRRAALGAIVGAPAALSAALAASPASGAYVTIRRLPDREIPAAYFRDHPMFGFQDLNHGSDAHVQFSVQYPGQEAPTTVFLGKEPEPERYETLREAEDVAFSYLTGLVRVRALSMRRDANAPLVQRQANLIRVQSQSHLGRGNSVMISEEYFEALTRPTDQFFYSDSREKPLEVDRWRFAGILANTTDVWVTRDPPSILKDGGALITHKGGPMNSGIILIRDEKGFGLFLRRPGPAIASLTDVRDYFRLCRLTTEIDAIEALHRSGDA